MARNNINALYNIKNAFLFGGATKSKPNTFEMNLGGSKDPKKNLSNFFMNVSPMRKVNDLTTWREAVKEMEDPNYPFRVKVQSMYLDVVLEPIVEACMNKRKEITLQREYILVDKDGNKDEYWSNYLNKMWMYNIIGFILDAKFYGYSLISIGDIVDSELVNPIVYQRSRIIPERLTIGLFDYDRNGKAFCDPEFSPWNIWVPTVNEYGTSSCGFGKLYSVTKLAIMLKNMLSDNADYMQTFATPMRVLKTDKLEGEEMNSRENMLSSMGSLGYAMISKEEELALLEASGGNGYKSYDNFEQRMNKAITQLILGHADVISSTPGKLGGDQGEDSAVYQALQSIKNADGKFIKHVVDAELLPRLRYHGINIPEDLVFEFNNNEEKEKDEDTIRENNLKTAEIVKTLYDAGKIVSDEWITEQTNITLTTQKTEQ